MWAIFILALILDNIGKILVGFMSLVALFILGTLTFYFYKSLYLLMIGRVEPNWPTREDFALARKGLAFGLSSLWREVLGPFLGRIIKRLLILTLVIGIGTLAVMAGLQNPTFAPTILDTWVLVQPIALYLWGAALIAWKGVLWVWWAISWMAIGVGYAIAAQALCIAAPWIALWFLLQWLHPWGWQYVIAGVLVLLGGWTLGIWRFSRKREPDLEI